MPSPRNADEVIRAAGAVLWRPGPDGPEVGLIHRPRYDDWSFPKGKVEPEEHVQLAAIREVAEETGYQVALSRRLPTITYAVSGRPKQVRYWAARARSDKEEDACFAPNDEVDELIWLGPMEARRQLTRWMDVTVLDAFLAMPAETVPILLLCHATAERRSGRYPEDRLRPLAERGVEQARTIASLLDTHMPLNPYSSSAVRCIDTVRPYAEGQDKSVAIVPALTEGADPQVAANWLRELVGLAEPAVLCSHKPMLEELLLSVLPSPTAKPDPTTLHRPSVSGRAGSDREYERLRTGRLSTGSAWVLHFTRPSDPRQPPALVSVDRLRS
ncbi:MAG TPA: NUDIX domain-containing protein [Actinocrinis sp.]|nr:NUDIX domain-containing protein [Actinocrinis sp.]